MAKNEAISKGVCSLTIAYLMHASGRRSGKRLPVAGNKIDRRTLGTCPIRKQRKTTAIGNSRRRRSNAI
jgi:hypothetical protein